MGIGDLLFQGTLDMPEHAWPRQLKWLDQFAVSMDI